MPEQRQNVLQDLGKEVRQKREELGLSLRDVHEGTKIRTQFLEGIERGDFSEFPGTVYVRGFIRTYLQFLGADEFWVEYLPVLSEGVERIREEEPAVIGSCTPPTKGFKPASRFWIFAILLLAAAGSSWYVWYTWDQNGVPSFAVREDDSGKNGGTVNSGAASDTVSPDAGIFRAGAVSPGEEPKNSSGTEQAESRPLSSDLQALPPAGMTLPPTAAELVGGTPSQGPAPAAEKKKDKDLVITANGDCWIRVRQGKKTLYERTLKAGEKVSFTVKERIDVTYGRAGSVRTRWNGEDLGTPGTTRGVERVFYAPDGKTGRIAR